MSDTYDAAQYVGLGHAVTLYEKKLMPTVVGTAHDPDTMQDEGGLLSWDTICLILFAICAKEENSTVITAWNITLENLFFWSK